jgi:hypothetical protein
MTEKRTPDYLKEMRKTCLGASIIHHKSHIALRSNPGQRGEKLANNYIEQDEVNSEWSYTSVAPIRLHVVYKDGCTLKAIKYARSAE